MMSSKTIYSGQSLMQAIEVNRLADILHSIGFNAGVMQETLRQLLPDEEPRAIFHCQGEICDGQMADLDRAMIDAGFTVRTATNQLIRVSAPWQTILEKLQAGEQAVLPRPMDFEPPELEICK